MCRRIPRLSFKIPLKSATALFRVQASPRCLARRVREKGLTGTGFISFRVRAPFSCRSIDYSYRCISRHRDDRDKIALISDRVSIRSTCVRYTAFVPGENRGFLSLGSARLGLARRNFRQYPSVTVFITHVRYEPLPVDPRHPLARLPRALQRECCDSKCRQANSRGP